ncbi:MAG: dioxygenase [Planctomycetes bacterium]|nr:dioxygenase [Planctomycetota bacterium]
MNRTRQSPLFLSHGAPSLLLEDVPARTFLEGLFAGASTRPRAVVVVSAHWLTNEPTVDASRTPRTIHDFSGFPAQLSRVQYPASGDPVLAGEIAAECARHGISARIVERGLDHGAWVPLALALPDATVPVLQVSLQPRRGAAYHLQLGRALARWRDADVLVVGSGSATHDLGSLEPPGSAAPAWVQAFDDWLVAAVERGDADALVDYRRRAPHAERNHPTEEHYLPLLVALGAAGEGARGRTLHRSTTFGVLAMSAFAFD